MPTTLLVLLLPLPLSRAAVLPAAVHWPGQAEKWEMLLPALALEYVTGQPASFVQSQVKYYRSKNAITGARRFCCCC